MRGLLLKDFMILWKSCRAYLLLIVVFIASAVLGSKPVFFLFPVIYAGIVPVTLMSLDEHWKWDQYSLTLPFSRKQLVTAKYLMGCFCTLGLSVLVSLVWGIFMLAGGETFQSREFCLILAAAVFIGFLGTAVVLPPVFKLGLVKGRIAYYIELGFVCGLMVFFIQRKDNALDFLHISGEALTAAILAGAVIVYVISWRISVSFYQKREL